MITIAHDWPDRIAVIAQKLDEVGLESTQGEWEAMLAHSPSLQGSAEEYLSHPIVRKSMEDLDLDGLQWMGAMHVSLIMAQVYMGTEGLTYLHSLNKFALAATLCEWFFDPDKRGEMPEDLDWPLKFVGFVIGHLSMTLYPSRIRKEARAMVKHLGNTLTHSDRLRIEEYVEYMWNPTDLHPTFH